MSTILLGVTGSIAAYKACELTRLFVKGGHDVHVIMTQAATRFVAPLTFRTLSRNPVSIDLFDEPDEWVPGHISLAERVSAVHNPIPPAGRTASSTRQNPAFALYPTGPSPRQPAWRQGLESARFLRW